MDKPTKDQVLALLAVSKIKSWFFTVMGFLNMLALVSTGISGIWTWWIGIYLVFTLYASHHVALADGLAQGAICMLEEDDFDEGD